MQGPPSGVERVALAPGSEDEEEYGPRCQWNCCRTRPRHPSRASPANRMTWRRAPGAGDLGPRRRRRLPSGDFGPGRQLGRAGHGRLRRVRPVIVQRRSHAAAPHREGTGALQDVRLVEPSPIGLNAWVNNADLRIDGLNVVDPWSNAVAYGAAVGATRNNNQMPLPKMRLIRSGKSATNVVTSGIRWTTSTTDNWLTIGDGVGLQRSFRGTLARDDHAGTSGALRRYSRGSPVAACRGCGDGR